VFSTLDLQPLFEAAPAFCLVLTTQLGYPGCQRQAPVQAEERFSKALSASSADQHRQPWQNDLGRGIQLRFDTPQASS
jgi:hypothetical protein